MWATASSRSGPPRPDARGAPALPAGLRAAAAAHAARVALAAGPAAAAGDARPGGLLAGRAQGRHGGRRPRPAALLPLPPGGVCGGRAAADVRRLAAGLLTAAGAALPAVRGDDRAAADRAHAGEGHARRARLDPAALLQPPALRAGQDLSRRRRVGVPGRPRALDEPPHD